MPLNTPDGRYLIVRGRLWRRADPTLEEAERRSAVDALMHARRAVKAAIAKSDAEALRSARSDVDNVKRRLGERGPVWWTDGAPDYGRRLAANTPYAEWWRLAAADEDAAP